MGISISLGLSESIGFRRSPSIIIINDAHAVHDVQPTGITPSDPKGPHGGGKTLSISHQNDMMMTSIFVVPTSTWEAYCLLDVVFKRYDPMFWNWNPNHG